jgi:uncharacterized MAPEG superfamily protein
MNADPHARRRLVLDIAGNVAALLFLTAAVMLVWTAVAGMSPLRGLMVVATLIVGLVLHLVAESVRRPLR